MPVSSELSSNIHSCHKSGNLQQIQGCVSHAVSAEREKQGQIYDLVGFSVKSLGIWKRLSEILSRNSKSWKETRVVIVGRIGISTLTGKPGGSFISTNSRNFLKCFTGATTSSTSNSIPFDRGNS